MQKTIEFCNELVAKYASTPSGSFFSEGNHSDPRLISWDAKNKNDVLKNRRREFDSQKIRIAHYRPFQKQFLYFDRNWNNSVYRIESIFPTKDAFNFGIDVVAPRTEILPTALMVDEIPDIALFSYAGIFFPRYFYEAANGSQFTFEDEADAIEGFTRRDNISDFALKAFQDAYSGLVITKDDIFYYVYGILHSPEYREAYGATLKKVLPRIPYASDFEVFVQAGQELAELHLHYEKVEPFDFVVSKSTGSSNVVEKLRYSRNGKEKNKTSIVFNSGIIIDAIPEIAHEYKIGSRSALDWVVDRYQNKSNGPSGISNDPNDWAEEQGDPSYIIDLLARIVTVSVETVKIMKSLPPLDIIE
jgi:predicted helicase